MTGKDTIEISVNGHAQFQINIDDGYVTVNFRLEECYKDNTCNLKNHNMGGEFSVLHNLAKMLLLGRAILQR